MLTNVTVLIKHMFHGRLLCRTYLFPRFLDPEKAEHFVKLAKARLRPSELAFKQGDTADNTRWVRQLQLVRALGFTSHKLINT